MLKTRVGVMRGGVGGEYEVSLNTGSSVLKHIPRDKYNVLDVLVTKDGQWHVDGLPIDKLKIARRVDVMFNALHGEYGEDGKVQRELELADISYTGSKVFSSALAMNKALAKYYFKLEGLLTPEHVVVKSSDDVRLAIISAFNKLDGPYVVKPLSAGSSVGVSVISDLDELYSCVTGLLQSYSIVLIEEYIAGRELACGVIDGVVESSEPYAILPIEIISPNGSDFWSYEDKYNGDTLEICPARLLKDTTIRIQDHAVRAHKALGMRHYSRTDFILSDRGLYVLETNSLPGLTTESLLPKSLKKAGLQFPDFLDYILTLALAGK